MNEKTKRVAFGALGIFVFLCIWYVATKFTSLGRIMPDPIVVFSNFFKAFVVPIGTKSMALHILISLRRMLIPYAVGGVCGVVIGILMGWYKVADSIFMPYIQMLRPIPPIAWIPLSIIWFGFGEGSKYFLIFLACLLPTGMVSLGSITMAALYPVLTLIYSYYRGLAAGDMAVCFVGALIMSILVIYMHRSNIKRIREGKEYRFGKKHQK